MRWFNNSLNFRATSLLAIAACTFWFSDIATAQRPRFPDFFQVQTPQTTPPQPGQVIVGPNAGASPIITSPPPITLTPPPMVLQTPNFDPYVSPSQPFPTFPTTQQPPQFQIYPPANNQPLIDPANTVPQIYLPPEQNVQILPPQFGGPVQNNANTWWPSNRAWPSQFWARMQSQYLPRLLERPRFSHTWLAGESTDGNELGINDIELATTMSFPNFLGTPQPLRISPGFILHLWSGPDEAVTGFDLPSRAYSGYLSFDYLSDPSRQAGLETNFTFGIYTDFDGFDSDSLRYTGVALGWARLNSYTTLKVGVEYFDRVDVKMLPAFGVFLAPNPDLRFNVYFPRPKLAQRLPNTWNRDVWVYVGGEYGGGSWVIERTAGALDQTDINDVRAFIGIESFFAQRITGFIEVGYVFDREIIYRSTMDHLKLDDTIMVRSGIAF
jgi:hypothetical protein